MNENYKGTVSFGRMAHSASLSEFFGLGGVKVTDWEIVTLGCCGWDWPWLVVSCTNHH